LTNNILLFTAKPKNPKVITLTMEDFGGSFRFSASSTGYDSNEETIGRINAFCNAYVVNEHNKWRAKYNADEAERIAAIRSLPWWRRIFTREY
jgi:hypothetical protein